MFPALVIALVMVGASVAEARGMLRGIPYASWGVAAIVIGGAAYAVVAAARAERAARATREMTMQLETANLRLSQLDKLKSEFLSFASHQIKAPMTVVKGYATLILDGCTGAADQQTCGIASKIKDSADRMIGLVNAFLDLRRIEEGRIQYVWAELDLVHLLETVTEELRQLAARKGLELKLEPSARPWRISADAATLRQVFQNLIDNAIKYTDKGSVTVSTEPGTNGAVRILIRDTGRGISPQLLPKLFGQFSRDPSVSREIAGTGLGLYIARQIIQAHRGTVWATSEGPGRGSTFVVQLPTV
jgi:signal transduction histidine kinase